MERAAHHKSVQVLSLQFLCRTKIVTGAVNTRTQRRLVRLHFA